ncbi:hypothetical protein DYU11_11000 [Fibrisoma montanum]|uniref:Uncharacterized protein n=1 Tax=Fibrisoma montanum TaxID=2305895 RepID=A0A418MCH2_9BACT|nr:hypothetical protein [Fibrisoma montanum]RIV24082.1 hypothetical protein DYU11_11000 [Fibrisoma montanum]
MRFLQTIPHPLVTIGLYAWNNKYIVKIEAGPYEQTFKVSELDVTGPDDVQALLDEPFLEQVILRFQAMDADWQATMERQGLV